MVTSGTVLVAAEVVTSRISSAVTEGDLFGEEDDESYGEDIEGPLNIVLAGVDTRPSRPEEPARADAIMIVHVPEELDRGYLISVPRDSLVEVPPFPDTGYLGGQDRINSSMFHGSRQVEGEQLPDLERGFQLLAATVGNLTGIERFDAGAVIRFEGFVDVVDAMDGITVELEAEIYSRHRLPDGRHRPLNPHGEGYLGEQAYYPPGVNELEGWQALDLARQRYGVDGSDYGRQQLQQMILKAMLDKAVSRDMVTNPIALDRVVQAAGDALIFDGRGNDPIDFAFALRELRPANITTITLPADNVGEGSAYQGEQLRPEASELFAALNSGRIGQFLVDNPDFIAD